MSLINQLKVFTVKQFRNDAELEEELDEITL